jgi:hypothetical protein
MAQILQARLPWPRHFPAPNLHFKLERFPFTGKIREPRAPALGAAKKVLDFNLKRISSFTEIPLFKDDGLSVRDIWGHYSYRAFEFRHGPAILPLVDQRPPYPADSIAV